MGFPVAVSNTRGRPTVVTAAGSLLFAVAGLLVVDVIVSGATFSTAVHNVDTTYAGQPTHDNIVATAELGIGFAMAFNVVLAVLFGVLAVFDLRGNNGMRITTWAVGGVGMLCLGCSFGNVTASTFQQNGTTSQAAAVKIRNVVPAWAGYTEVVVNITALLALVIVIILLALPASNAFFRKTPPMTVGYPGYPTGSAYPIDPAYQPYPPRSTSEGPTSPTDRSVPPV
jgi:hypothetical protein